MMTDEQHAQVQAWIDEQKVRTGKHPSQRATVLAMLNTGAAITQKDAEQYGLGAAFRARLSDLRRLGHDIDRIPVVVGSRFGNRRAVVYSHRLASEAFYAQS